MSNQENNSKETKKTRRKRSKRTAQQIKLAVIMIMVSVLVLSASTFAWYKMSKTANIQSMEFKADTLGNLLISEDDTNYSSELDLGLTGNSAILLPATTVDGKVFYQPKYNGTGDTVTDVSGLSETDISGTDEDEAETFKKFVYKKEFYIKSGVNEDLTKSYDLILVDGSGKTEENKRFTAGTFLNDNSDNTTFDSLNAVRVSFVINDDSETVKIFTPACTTNNGSGTHATDSIDKSTNNYGGYDVDLEQDANGKFTDATLCTITEGKSVKITMYVWFEGTDDDCENEIALDTLSGQIQFEAKPTTTSP